MRFCLLIVLFCFATQRAGAQTTITGTLTDTTGAPVGDALLLLFRQDTTLVKTAISNSSGAYFFEVSDSAQYFLKISAEGYHDFFSPLFKVSATTDPGIIRISRRATDLSAVEVTASQPFLERKPGMLVLNVENSVFSSGSSAFELLEKSPGVTVSSNDIISLNGKTGIMVQIDGKRTPMTGSDLANYLRGIPSSSIEKIELITNPSAKYDAAGSSIINIRLKKDTHLGTNGTLTSGYGQGVYPKTNAGVSLNYRTRKINLYGSYNYSYRKGFNHLVLERKFYENDTFQGAYIQNNFFTFPFHTNILRAGTDITIDKKNSIGFVVSGVSNKFSPSGGNTSDVVAPDGAVASRFDTQNNSRENWFNGSANLNYRRELDTLGSEWTTDLDYARYSHISEQLFTTGYYDLNGQPFKDAYLLYGDMRGSLAIHSAKTDLHKQLRHHAYFEAGLKSSYVIADNDLRFFDRSSGNDLFDSTKSNHFIYKETINAAFATYGKELGKWNFSFGLRAEYTGISGEQRMYSVISDTSYLQLFPSANINYTRSEKHTFEFSYNRRIDRPGYNQLNPFKQYLDPSTYQQGNPYLRPQTTHTLQIGYLWKQRIYTQFGFARTSDNITEVIAPAENETNVTVQTNTNLRRADLIYLNFSAPLQPTEWWSSINNVNGYAAFYSGDVASTLISNRGNLVWDISSNNSFSAGKTWIFELNGRYHSREVYAFDSIRPIWSIGLGVQKKILHNMGSLRLNVTDLFYTSNIRADVRYRDYKEYFDVKRETRVATLTFTYKFGKASVPASRRRDGGADDLKSRAGS